MSYGGICSYCQHSYMANGLLMRTQNCLRCNNNPNYMYFYNNVVNNFQAKPCTVYNTDKTPNNS